MGRPERNTLLTTRTRRLFLRDFTEAAVTYCSLLPPPHLVLAHSASDGARVCARARNHVADGSFLSHDEREGIGNPGGGVSEDPPSRDLQVSLVRLARPQLPAGKGRVPRLGARRSPHLKPRVSEHAGGTAPAGP